MSVSLPSWRRRFGSLVVGLAASLSLVHPIHSLAVELTWTGNGGIFFNDPANWNPMQPPTSADNLTFDASATNFDLIMAGALAGNELRFLGGTYRMEGGSTSSFLTDDAWIDGGALTVTGENTLWTPEDLVVGDLATGALDVESDASVPHTGLFLGQSALGSGTLNLSGTNSRLGTTAVGSIGRIGVNGLGTLNISGGARADFSSNLIGQFVGSVGTVNVAGAGSDMVANGFDIRVGNEGAGFLNVTDGGNVIATGSGNLSLGQVLGSSGTVLIDAGNIDVGSRIYIGRDGTGTFTAENGSNVSSNLQFVAGETAGSFGTATFDGSTLSVDNAEHDLIVGRHGQGQVTFKNGSTATISDDILIGNNAASTGDNRLVITGGSNVSTGTTTSNAIIVGNAGNGTLVLDGGSSLTSRGLTTAGSTDATGTVTVDGAGTNLNLGVLFVSNSGTSTMDVTGGAQVHLNTNENLDSNLFVGDDTTANGTLNISGSDGMGTASAVIANKMAEIGGSANEVGGTGTVNIMDGGRLSTAGAQIGLKDNNDAGVGGTGVVNISDAGSIWESSAEVIVGDNGQGHLNITGGGQASFAANVRVGNENTADDGPASLTVAGVGSALTIQGELSVGDDREASMTVSDGAVVTSGADGNSVAHIGRTSSALGAIVTVDNATWNHDGGRIKVGTSGGNPGTSSTLRVVNGGQVHVDGWIMVADDSSTADGFVEIIGSGSQANSSGSIIGDVLGSAGALNVLDGGAYNAGFLHISGSGTGIADVSGAGTTVTTMDELAVGRSNHSNGTLTIADGAGVVTGGEVQIARDAGSTGTLNVNVGGTLSVQSGAMVTVGGTLAALGGNGTLNVQGGVVDVAGDQVAVTANGILNLSSGQLILASLNRTTGSQVNFTGGRLTMTGNQVLDTPTLDDIFNGMPTLTSGMELEVGGAASLDASLRLNGGKLVVGSIADLAQLDWDAGTLAIGSDVSVAPGGLLGNAMYLAPNQTLEVGGQLTNDGLISSGGGMVVTTLQNNGDLVLLNTNVEGAIVSPAGSTITVVGTVDFSGPVTGAADFFGPGTANFNSIYAPGDSPETIAFEGSIAFGNLSTLAVELGGTNGGEFDQLLVDGAAAIDGLLDVTLVDVGMGLYTPQVGDTFTILTATEGLSGSFATTDLPALAGGLGWQLSQDANSVFLSVGSGSLMGDFDDDGDLDSADIDLLVAELAGMSGNLAFDLTADGVLNAADLQEWLALGGAANLASGNAYIVGDANLDGAVDGQDFITWNDNKFSLNAAWSRGDFNADGSIDGQDFIAWNDNKFTAADVTVGVPEPATGGLWWLVVLVFGQVRRSKRNAS